MAFVTEQGLSWALTQLQAYRRSGGRDLQTMFGVFVLKHRGVGTVAPTVVSSTEFDETCQQLLQIVRDGDPTSEFGAVLFNVFGDAQNPLVKPDWGRSTPFTRYPNTVGMRKVVDSNRVAGGGTSSRVWQFTGSYVGECLSRIPAPFPALALAMFLFRRPSDSNVAPFNTHAELLASFRTFFNLNASEAALFDYTIPGGVPALGNAELTRAKVIELVAVAEPGCPLQVRLAATAGTGPLDVGAEVVACAQRMGQVLLFGPPGTGKSYWAWEAGLRLAGFPSDRLAAEASGRVEFVAWHPSWTYEDFVRRVVVRDGDVQTEPGVFQTFCETAGNSDDPHVLIIDEINRGNTVAILGELMYALELDKRGTAVRLSDGSEFSVPRNLYVLATANTADKSIAALDTALGRRFARVEVPPDPAALGAQVISGVSLAELLAALNASVLEVLDREHLVGHSYFMDEAGALLNTQEDLLFAMRYRIIPLLQDYFLEDFDDLHEVLGDGFIDAEAQQIRRAAFGSWDAFNEALQKMRNYP